MISKTKNVRFVSKNYFKNVYKLLKKKNIVFPKKKKKKVSLPTKHRFKPIYNVFFFKKFQNNLMLKGKAAKARFLLYKIFNNVRFEKRINPTRLFLLLSKRLSLFFRLLNIYKSGKAVPIPTSLTYVTKISLFMRNLSKAAKLKKGLKSFEELYSKAFVDPIPTGIQNNLTSNLALKSRKYMRYRW